MTTGKSTTLTLLAFLFVASVAGSSAPAAVAGTVELRGDRLEITGDANTDWFRLWRVADEFRIYQQHPDGTLTTASPGCELDTDIFGLTHVACPMAGVRRIDASTGAGDDYFELGLDTQEPPHIWDRNDCRQNDLRGAKLKLRTGDGSDWAELSKDRDVIRGGDHADTLYGCGGKDEVKGGAGNDFLSGDRGKDLLAGGRDHDQLIGCYFNTFDFDFPLPEPGNDTLRGGRGPDFLLGCMGADKYRAGGGTDKLETSDRFSDKVHCGGGIDRIFSDPSDRLNECERHHRREFRNGAFIPLF